MIQGNFRKNIQQHGIITVLLLFMSVCASAQDRQYAQMWIDSLAGPTFHGRGYTQNGALKAAGVIAAEMEKVGLSMISEERGWFHNFTMPVNTFPNDLTAVVGSRELEVGRDYVPVPGSGSFSGSSQPVFLSISDIRKKGKVKSALKQTQHSGILVIDTFDRKDEKSAECYDLIQRTFSGGAIVLLATDLTWSVSRAQMPYCMVKMRPQAFRLNEQMALEIEPLFIEKYQGANVIGFLRGNEQPDSFILLTGHYDHLGGMGQTYIPGANDNASGIAMILDMAKEFAEQKSNRYSFIFIGFGGEEAGLVGSYHFVNELSDWIPADKIRFVVNMDLMGSGQEGIMAVNGRVFTDEFDMLKDLNDNKGYLTDVRARGKAANSDHYFFSERGIPAFFFYLMGPYHHYHNVNDSPKNLRLDEHYDKSFRLIRDFIGELQK